MTTMMIYMMENIMIKKIKKIIYKIIKILWQKL